MKLTKQIIECQAKKASRLAEDSGIYVDENDYASGGLWVYYKMKQEIRNSFKKGICIGVITGSILVLILKK